jgi:AcrR family transcriptional regulator
MNTDPKEFRERAVKDAKCALILDAARRQFAQKGYWETRLEDIAAAAGFSKASLYNYYVDKEAIFLSIVIDENSKIMEAIEAVVKKAGPFTETMESILRIIFNVILNDIGIMVNAANFQNMIAMHTNMFKHKGLLEQFIASTNHFFKQLKECITRARKAGEIASSLDDETLARFIGTLIKGTIFEFGMEKRQIDHDSSIAQMITFIKQGTGEGSGSKY